jgi:phosphotransferase system HPr-like phosphotransfer protein
MSEVKVYLKEIDDVKEFVKIVMLVKYDVDLVSGRYAVDAKSIMGIFSLDLSKPITLKAQTEDPEELFAQLKAKGFIVE